MPSTPQNISSHLAEDAALTHTDNVSNANDRQQAREAHTEKSTVSDEEATTPTPLDPPASSSRSEQPEEYVSKIGILTSSLPMYHNQFMKERKADRERRRLQEQGEPLEPHEAEMLSKMSLEVGNREQTGEEQAETARRLKPHSRSTIQLQNITANAHHREGVVLDMRGKPKQKSTKWQFGIRSRNEPIDAVKCLYKALIAMGDCQWHVPPPKNKSKDDEPAGPFPVNVKGATHLTLGESTLSESPEKDKHHLHPGHRSPTKDPAGSGGSGADNTRDRQNIADAQDDSESENDEDIDPNVIPPHYAPKDPWVIHVRWEKKGMSPPGATNTSSARSSRVDLQSNDGQARRGSVAMGSLSSTAGSTTSVPGISTAGTNAASAEALSNFTDTACFVYMDLQIYVLEAETYLVDFKCAGYESIVGERQVKNRKGEMITEYIGSGNRKSEKEVTSPQPFLDLANKLVIHLAKGAQ